MKKSIKLLAIAAILAVVLISGCTQQPLPNSPAGGNGNPSTPTNTGAIDKATEDKAAAALESELSSAVDNISTSDIENSLLNQ